MESMHLWKDKNTVSNGFKVLDSYKINESTEGSEEKFFIRVNGAKYLVKDSSWNKRRKQKSYAPYCEYVASNFIRNAGIACHKTFLGTYKERVVVICEDLFPDMMFQPFKELHQSSADTDLRDKEYTYSDVLYVLQKRKNLTGEHLKEALYDFWVMFLLDAILGNRDRHEGNWGFVKKEGIVKLAPIFDNGSSLFPDVDLSNWKHADFVRERTYRIPASQFKMWKPGITDRPMRTNFWEMIRDFSDEFKEEKSFIETLDIKKLIEDSIVDVPDYLAEWYSVIIYSRFNCLILGRDFNEVWEEISHDLY